MKAILAAVCAGAFAMLGWAASAQPATTRTLVISTESANPQIPFQGFDGNPPKLFDFNRDGRLEIVAQDLNQWVYVFDAQTGAILAELRTSMPSYWEARSFNGPEAVIDGDGHAHLIVMNSAAYVTSYRLDAGTSSAARFDFVMEWERRLEDCHADPGADSKPVIADLDRDGIYEIVVATEELGLYALRADGSVFWKNCMGGGNAEPTVGDVDMDGWPDVVFGSDGGVVTMLDGQRGWTKWAYRVLDYHDLVSASIPVGAALGQLDGVGGLDVVVGVRDSHDPIDWSNNHAMLLALDEHGAMLWASQDVEANPLTYTRPIVTDTDGDGAAEIYWGDWNTIGQKGGIAPEDSWKLTGPAHVYRYDTMGNVVWRQTMDAYWSNKDLALADTDGDGVQEVLVNGPGVGGDGIWALDSRTGEMEAFVTTAPWKVARGPVIGDLAGTGTMQIVVVGSAAEPTVSGGGIVLFDTGQPLNSAWPHLPDAAVAVPPLPLPPPPVPDPVIPEPVVPVVPVDPEPLPDLGQTTSPDASAPATGGAGTDAGTTAPRTAAGPGVIIGLSILALAAIRRRV